MVFVDNREIESEHVVHMDSILRGPTFCQWFPGYSLAQQIWQQQVQHNRHESGVFLMAEEQGVDYEQEMTQDCQSCRLQAEMSSILFSMLSHKLF